MATNLWGPTPIYSDFGYKYYIAFIDVYSRFTWIYFLMAKSETNNVVINFITMAEKHLMLLSRLYSLMMGMNLKF